MIYESGNHLVNESGPYDKYTSLQCPKCESKDFQDVLYCEECHEVRETIVCHECGVKTISKLYCVECGEIFVEEP